NKAGHITATAIGYRFRANKDRIVNGRKLVVDLTDRTKTRLWHVVAFRGRPDDAGDAGHAGDVGEPSGDSSHDVDKLETSPASPASPPAQPCSHAAQQNPWTDAAGVVHCGVCHPDPNRPRAA
ncbi:MAG: hypothetical protein ACRDH5_15650, partial [bacterium]